MHKGRVECVDQCSGLVDFVLQRLHCPMRLFPLPQNTRDFAYFVFNWPIFGMILWPSNDAKLTRTLPPRDCLMDVRRVMCSQVVPNKIPVVIHSLHSKLLYLCANVVAKITENVGCCSTALDTPNPTPRTLNTSADVQRKPWITRLDCKEERTSLVVEEDSHLLQL